MSFKFNFEEDVSDKEDSQPTTKDKNGSSEKSNDRQTKEILAKDITILEEDEIKAMVSSNGVEIRVIDLYEDDSDDDDNENSDVTRAKKLNSDLLPAVYEGGMKIWECSVDLINYFSESKTTFDGKRVIELGCGAALPALYALVQHAQCIHFHDYNEEVIKKLTIPNAALNVKDGFESSSSRCRFFCGDWSSLWDLLQADTKNLPDSDKYDIILTSETIYSPESYLKLHDVICDVLKPDGVVYLAAKTYYFGVGGGTRDFEDLVKTQNRLTSHVLKTIPAGVNREILELRFQKKDASVS